MVQENSLKERPPLIIITGPTAVGKSEVAVEVALAVNGEIIGADSMQIYKRMDIGTGKIPISERKGILHYLIDIIEPNAPYTVEQYVNDVEKAIEEIYRKGKRPIVVGGTGLYIDALINGHNFANTGDSGRREYYQNLANEKGNEHLFSLLMKVDPVSCEKISINDTKRLIRALEIYDATGIPKSKAVEKSQGKYPYCLFILNQERETLYKRINQRVIKMFEAGLIEEVKALASFATCQSMQAIGYKEILQMTANNSPLDAIIERIQKNSRHYAKRQLTYFRWFQAEKIWLAESYFKQIIANI